jgi:hypothetical protein
MAELPDELAALAPLALDELLDFKMLVEFEIALAIALAGLFNPAGINELFAPLVDIFGILGILGIAGIMLFIF